MLCGHFDFVLDRRQRSKRERGPLQLRSITIGIKGHRDRMNICNKETLLELGNSLISFTLLLRQLLHEEDSMRERSDGVSHVLGDVLSRSGRMRAAESSNRTINNFELAHSRAMTRKLSTRKAGATAVVRARNEETRASRCGLMTGSVIVIFVLIERQNNQAEFASERSFGTLRHFVLKKCIENERSQAKITGDDSLDTLCLKVNCDKIESDRHLTLLTNNCALGTFLNTVLFQSIKFEENRAGRARNASLETSLLLMRSERFKNHDLRTQVTRDFALWTLLSLVGLQLFQQHGS